MQNLILAVGPGTPASIMFAHNLKNRGHVASMEEEYESEEDESDSEEEDQQLTWNMPCHHQTSSDEEEEEENESDSVGQASEDEGENLNEDSISRRRGHEAQGSDDDDDDDDDELQLETDQMEAMQMFESFMQQQQQDNDHQGQQQHLSQSWKSDLRHSGCINTACWLDVPWRLSSSNSSSNSNEQYFVINDEGNEYNSFNYHGWNKTASCPTQLATSGDDRVVKLWDARFAMGSANPQHDGWDTFSPLSSTKRPSGYQAGWKKFYKDHKDLAVAGSVIPLATISTGHSRNVFHVSPISQSPGKLLTCAADGFLRLIDIVSNTSSVVINPFSHNDELSSFLSLGGGLAFSHVMLGAQTGLLCSERGLHLFDLRLPAGEQSTQSLLASSIADSPISDSASVSSESYSTSNGCKACAVWRPSAAETSSHYVFAGGSGACVDLYDLRMDGSQKQVVERYRPRNIEHPENLAVSGLDLSKDGKELLVSYESDQIYAFPIMGKDKGGHFDPTFDETNLWAAQSGNRSPTAEACGYGGHLNRFTFLKNARYAGPHDEYICTGSDSGHAWIMDRGTGTCVSLMSADSSTCNGVVPHPMLPFFITYGIDSSARIWRATTPVDPEVSSSCGGISRCVDEETYEMSPVTQSAKVVQMLCSRYESGGPGVLPDFIATRQEIATSGKFSAPNRRGMIDYDSPRIGNSLRSLNSILRSNRYECYRSAQQGMGTPVECHVDCFTLRVSISRLKLQATRLGVSFHLNQPWNFRCVKDTHPADLVPDFPSDWILLDDQMTPSPTKIDTHHLNWKDWDKYLIEREPQLTDFQRASKGSLPVWIREELKEDSPSDDFSWPVRSSLQSEKDEDCRYFSEAEKAKSQSLLYKTAKILKQGGNVALKDGHLDTAARRYDKAIQYCSISFLNYFEGDDKLHHLKDGLNVIPQESGRQAVATPVVWSPLLRILITSRLNMALLLLKPHFANISDSISQSAEALRLLGPFTAKCGAVVVSTSDLREDPDDEKEENFLFENEPEETYHEARALQAKAFFRLGSAEMVQGDWSAAVDAFQASIHSSDKPDSLVVRRLQEAKLKRASKKKRDSTLR